jgi:signal transduction histidine kinase
VEYSPHALLDLRYPDFTARHVFTAKLRLLIIVGFWFLCVVLFPGLLTVKQPIMLMISGTFVMTTIAYAFILKGIWPIFFFTVELAADLLAQTILIYMTGGAASNYITIYIIYCAAGGLFYNYRVSAVISLLASSFYLALLASMQWGWIQPFSYPFPQDRLLAGLGPFQNFTLLTISLGISIYGVWIASHFTKLREKVLEAKNKELIALNRVASITRSVITLERVNSEVLRGAKEGMGYETAFLLYWDGDKGIRVFMERGDSYAKEFEKFIGVNVDELYLPLDDKTNMVYQSVRKKKVVIRYDFSEILKGIEPAISAAQAQAFQRRFGFHKFVAAPLVAEEKVLGALIGVSREQWIESQAIKAFEGFADQAALTIDNAMLIAELKKKNIELERVSRVKSEFLATMSHELRTPLTAIIGFSELLLEEVMGNLNADQKESLREVLVNGENLLQLINGILDLAKIESGKMELSVGPIVIEDLLQRVQKMISSLIQKKGQVLEIDVEKPIPLVYADERKLQQILLNLLSNANKFTPNGGTIRVAVRYAQEILEVSVSDTGVGIQKKDLASVFESFHQADSSYTREYQGTGLGLALVKQFVQLHGGTIFVESEAGKGAKFTLRIPSRSKTLEAS